MTIGEIMKNTFAYFTAGEFAKIHNLNKRTLHYYDEIGIFSPKYKGENGYRYYSFEQSIELENILALRELGMSIDEIKTYVQKPNSKDFCNIAFAKMEEIDKTIIRLKQLKKELKQKSETLMLCDEIYHGKIDLAYLPKQYLFLTKLSINFDTHENFLKQSSDILEHLREAWSFSSYRRNCGSYISIEKIKNGNFDIYDGIYTQVDAKRKNLYIKPQGQYLRGFCVGDWDNIPDVYEKMLDFAESQNLHLRGYAFESGLNEFAISNENEYITQIEILCEEFR